MTDRSHAGAGPAPEVHGLRARTFSGMAWNLVAVGGMTLLQATVLAVLARLVTPEDFGVVAASLIVVNFVTLLAEVGLGPALVQRTHLEPDHVRVAMTTFMLLGMALWAGMWWQAEAIAGLLRVPPLSRVLPVIGFTFVIHSLSMGGWLLQRAIRFRELALVSLFSFGVGYGLVAILLALRGFGYWAIVWGHIGNVSVRTMLFWWRAPHPMRPSLRWRHLKELLSFGGGHMLGRVTGQVGTEGDSFVVARWLGAAALGLYGRAYQLMVLPSELFGRIVNKVLFPAMASVQHQQDRLRAAYLTATATVALGTVPVAVVAAVVSRELVLVLLGPDWLGLVVAFDVMVVGIVLRTGSKICDALTQAAGAVYRRAARQALFALLIVGGAYALKGFGIAGVAVAVVIGLAVNFLLMSHLSLTLTQLTWGQLLRAHAPAGLVGLGVAVVVVPVTLVLRVADAPALLILLLSSASAVGAMLLVARVAPMVPWPGSSLVALLREVLAMVPAGRGPGRVARRVLGPAYATVADPGQVDVTIVDQPTRA